MSNIEEDIMSEEAFNELIDNFEIVGTLTEYSRKAIKQNVKNLQKRIKELEEQVEYDITHIITPKTIELNYVPKQKVKEGLERIEDYFYGLNGPDEDIEYIRNIKKELLEEK